jgi:light-regulated signal transduction histidine kinase (bacteriophytochrome)
VASHDLQEPLRMVASYTQLLARRYRGQIDRDADEYIDYAVDGVARMQRLIRDLLEYSRVRTSPLESRVADAAAAFDTAVANLKTSIDSADAVVTRSALPEVAADSTLLVQLLQNLIGNALKFRKPNERPTVTVSATAREREWVFSVGDNGIGLEPQFAERIFVIFKRLHGRDAYPGTGIGLAICKKIVERHSGRIWVESELGKGSVFYFSLPRNASARKDPSAV